MRLSLGAWWPEGRSSSSVSQFLPSCSWSTCQMAVWWKDGYRGDLSPWLFLQLCFCSVWGRCPAERGGQTLRCAQLSARLSAELCSPDLWRYYTILRWRHISGLSSWTTSLLCLHGITRFCHSETWLFISLLCWCHSTLPLIPSWWSDDSCSHLRLSNRHFLLDEGPSPSTQPCQDRTACGFSKPIVSSQFHHPVRLINHNSFKNSQKPWSYDWWSAEFLRPHC